MSIKAISYNIESVGKTIKDSKKKFTWNLEIDKKKVLVEFWASIKGSKKI